VRKKDLLQRARRKARLLIFGENSRIHIEWAAMIKKRAKKEKGSAKRKGTTKKRGTKKGSKKREPNPVKVQKDIALLVESKAKKMVAAVISRGMSGQVAPVKFALEVANIHPHAVDANQSTSEEDCLAKTLLDRLGLPTTPVVDHDEDNEEKVGIAGRAAGDDCDDGEKMSEKAETAKSEGEIESTPDVVVGCE
jgi:hypothetical protein